MYMQERPKLRYTAVEAVAVARAALGPRVLSLLSPPPDPRTRQVVVM